MVLASPAHMFQPANLAGLHAASQAARQASLSIVLRGAGCSYGRAALNDGGVMIDLTRMNRILDWDAATGIMTVEPGVTLRQVWQTALPDGFWPPVVTGTMMTTVGGCAAMNVHGKNHYKVGSFGEHVLDFVLLLPSGDLLECSRERNADLFYAALGGLGLLGCFVRLRLQLMKAPTGLLDVKVLVADNLDELMETFEQQPVADYQVGWVDCAATGAALGRGIIHQARQVEADEVDDPTRTLSLQAQKLTHSWLGIPFSVLKHGLRLARRPVGIRMINGLKYHATRLGTARAVYRQSLADYSFLLDTIPDWKQAFHGLFQYQCMIPGDKALPAFQELISLSQRAGLTPSLGVLKKHRPDPFLLSYTLDGYSLALEYPAQPGRMKPIEHLAARLDAIVREAGGRLYLAKNISPHSAPGRPLFPPGHLERFIQLKSEYDPACLLQSDLSRDLLGPLGGLGPA